MKRKRDEWVPKAGGKPAPIRIHEAIGEREKAGHPIAPLAEPIWMTYEEAVAAGLARMDPKPPTPQGPTS